MVYITGDGTVRDKAPWELQSISKFFYGAIYFIIYFFRTLFGLDTSGTRNSGGSRTGGGSSSSKGSGGGGGGGPWRPGGGGGGGPSRRIMTMKDINPPTVGGCPGGACGR